MQTIQVQKDGDIYYCDVGINKDEWLEILKDESVADNYKEAVACFYYLPNHKGSCVSAGKPFGKKPASLNTNVWQFGKYVQNRLNRFELVGTDEKSTFWPVVMGQGRVLKGDEEGSFEWLLRPELAEAVKDYLYWNLLEKYKKHRQTIAFDTDYAYEVYKWQLITVCQGKTPIEIVNAHNANPTKPEKGGFSNLIDAPRDNAVLKQLAADNLIGLENTLNKLVDESKDLNDRLFAFKTSIEEMLADATYNSKANDERTASTILTCHNPQRYTFYKNDFYKKLCDYLGVEAEKAGRKYAHYLQLIEPLVHLIEKDQELESIVKNSSIANLLQSNLLLAQDVCWEMFVAFPGGKNYWLLSWNPDNWNWEDYEDWAKGTKSGKTYKMSWTCSSKQPNIGDHIFLMKTGDKPRGIVAHGKVVRLSYEAPHYDSEKAATGKTAPHIDVEFDEIRNYATESILQIETLTKMFPEQTWNPQSSGIQIKCDVNELQKMWNELQGNLTIKDMDKYIELLKENHNIILTGAPGTGKTYLAKQIAKQMIFGESKEKLTNEEQILFNERCHFVQFHPSYDYTDFVEGLRPINDKGNVGFERKDGTFKDFCKIALSFNTKIEDIEGRVVKNQSMVDEKIETIKLRILNFLEKNKSTEYEYNNGMILYRFDRQVGDDLIFSARWRNPASRLPQNIVTINMPIFIKYFLFDINLQDELPENHKDYMENKYVWAYYENFENEIMSDDEIKQLIYETRDLIESRKCVFIIDEINRGEISKIFGELFFSIDPGYRGKNGRVQTQYQNLVDDEDEFKNGFFVPENVYIIGTMNDIDRSVESMDFAFRRRFAFIEVKANENTRMLDGMEWKDDAIKRMNSLNAEIEKIDGLSSAYHIGASYFLKLKNYNGDFDHLWKYHLEGLLREYLRGTQGVDENIKKLENAYNLINDATDDSDSNN